MKRSVRFAERTNTIIEIESSQGLWYTEKEMKAFRDQRKRDGMEVGRLCRNNDDSPTESKPMMQQIQKQKALAFRGRLECEILRNNKCMEQSRLPNRISKTPSVDFIGLERFVSRTTVSTSQQRKLVQAVLEAQQQLSVGNKDVAMDNTIERLRQTSLAFSLGAVKMAEVVACMALRMD